MPHDSPISHHLRTRGAASYPTHRVLVMCALTHERHATRATDSAAAPQVTFIGLHWQTGTPVWDDQGAYSDDTFWEQLEGGVPWTRAKKFLLTIPVALCVVVALWLGGAACAL